MANNTKKTSYWNKEKALLWMHGHIPPNRPSFSELSIYTKVINNLKTQNKKIIKILILGSTKSFIDLAIENYLDVTVVDCSEEYFTTVLDNIDCRFHKKNIKYINEEWLNIDFNAEFDIIIGDLVIGNVKNEDLPKLVTNISKACKKNGVFITKSFFVDSTYKKKSVEEIFKKYKNTMSFYHPYSTTVYDMVISHLDDKNIINFNFLKECLCFALKKNKISKMFFQSYKIISSHSDGYYYITDILEWENLIRKYFILNIKYGEEVYSTNFPIYLLTKK